MRAPGQSIVMILTLTLAAVATASVGVTRASVSPGAVDRVAVIDQRCPTFSWEAAPGAALYELVAYALPGYLDEAAVLAVDLRDAEEALYSRVPGGATSWTPSSELCFAPGGRYVWFVRAVFELVDGEVVDAGEWSEGRYFAIPAAPSTDEVARALEVLQRYVETGGEAGQIAVVTSRSPVRSPTTKLGGGGLKSVPTAEAAIRGEHSDVSGEVYGVVGTTASYDGAGVAAANLDGGPDLVLDGSADGTVDTFIQESVLTRSSPDDQVFLFHNGGGGTLDLYVHGTLNGDGLNVQYGPVIDDAGNWLGVGDTIPCADCVGSADIVDGSIIDNDLADDAVTEEKIEHGAVSSSRLANSSVTTLKILDGTITEADLADGAVTGDKISDGSIKDNDLADGAVTDVKIQPGSVNSSHLQSGSVTSAKIVNGTITVNDLADNSVTGGKIVDGAVDTSALRNGAVTSTKIFDGSVTTADLADGSVTGAKILDGGITRDDLADWSVSGPKIADGVVDSPKLSNGSVTSAKIFDGTITGADIGSGEVSTSHLMNMSVGTAKLGTGVVTSSKVADGTLTAADVDPAGGIYSTKTAVYSLTGTMTLNPGTCGTPFAECSDGNDLPLQGSCQYPPSTPVNFRGTEAMHWDDATTEALWACDYCLEGGSGSADFSATIHCISVPGT